MPARAAREADDGEADGVRVDAPELTWQEATQIPYGISSQGAIAGTARAQRAGLRSVRTPATPRRGI